MLVTDSLERCITMAVGSNNTGHMSDNRLAHGYGKHLWGICIERRHSCDKLIQYGSQAPPVHFSTMACAQQQLRRQVVGSPHCAPLLLLHAPHMPHSCMSQALMMALTSCLNKFDFDCNLQFHELLITRSVLMQIYALVSQNQEWAHKNMVGMCNCWQVALMCKRNQLSHHMIVICLS